MMPSAAFSVAQAALGQIAFGVDRDEIDLRARMRRRPSGHVRRLWRCGRSRNDRRWRCLVMVGRLLLGTSAPLGADLDVAARERLQWPSHCGRAGPTLADRQWQRRAGRQVERLDEDDLPAELAAPIAPAMPRDRSAPLACRPRWSARPGGGRHRLQRRPARHRASARPMPLPLAARDR